MELTNFEESNIVFDKPDSMTYEECSAASAWMGPTEDGNIVTITCWKMTQEELEEFQKTGRIWVYHWGPSLQPHSLGTRNPFK